MVFDFFRHYNNDEFTFKTRFASFKISKTRKISETDPHSQFKFKEVIQ